MAIKILCNKQWSTTISLFSESILNLKQQKQKQCANVYKPLYLPQITSEKRKDKACKRKREKTNFRAKNHEAILAQSQTKTILVTKSHF